MKQSFFVMFFIVINANSFLLTSIGIHLLMRGSVWLGVACFMLGLYGLVMTEVLIKKTVLTRLKSDENGNITSFTIDAK